MTLVTTPFRKLSYEYRDGLCHFEDGTVYTVREMIYLARHDLPPEDENAIHAVKKVFGGEVDTTKPLPYVQDWLTAMGNSFTPPARPTVSGPLEPLQRELDL